jgi:hypothetical protein
MAHEKPNEDAAGYTDSKTNNVNDGESLVLFDVPKSDLQMILEHYESP